MHNLKCCLFTNSLSSSDHFFLSSPSSFLKLDKKWLSNWSTSRQGYNLSNGKFETSFYLFLFCFFFSFLRLFLCLLIVLDGFLFFFSFGLGLQLFGCMLVIWIHQGTLRWDELKNELFKIWQWTNSKNNAIV
jgi:hypothetical protein